MELIQKTGFVNSARPYFHNAESEIYSLFKVKAKDVSYDGVSPIEWLMAFYKDSSDINNELVTFITKLKLDGQIWLAWPKKASKVKSNLSDTVVRNIGLQNGLVDVKVVSVNETWSALKFVFRLKDR